MLLSHKQFAFFCVLKVVYFFLFFSHHRNGGEILAYRKVILLKDSSFKISTTQEVQRILSLFNRTLNIQIQVGFKCKTDGIILLIQFERKIFQYKWNFSNILTIPIVEMLIFSWCGLRFFMFSVILGVLLIYMFYSGVGEFIFFIFYSVSFLEL